MLKDSSRKGLTREKRHFLIAIAVLTVIGFAVKAFFPKDRTPAPKLIVRNGLDSMVFDIANWDSTKIDSFVKTLHSLPTSEDDSMYKVFKLEAIDSLMSIPTTPLVDSVLKAQK